MKEQKQERKSVRSYKVHTEIYRKAVKKAKSEKTTVSRKVADFLYDYISR